MIAYNKIISASGLSGLFELIASKKDGAILRSLEDGSNRFVSSRLHQFSHLESIEIYTAEGNVNLAVILLAMKASDEKLPDPKDNKALTAYFKKVYPILDFERVYTSDMRKMVKWLALLIEKEVDIALPSSDAPERESTEDFPPPADAETPEAPEEKPAKKASKKTSS